jgi:hypothetical protein
VGVEVTAEGKSPTVGWFRLKWWSFHIIPDKEGEPDQIWDLRYAHVEFENAPE